MIVGQCTRSGKRQRQCFCIVSYMVSPSISISISISISSSAVVMAVGRFLCLSLNLLVLGLFVQLKLKNYEITSALYGKSSDWRILISTTRPILPGSEAYRARSRLSQLGAILSILDSKNNFGSLQDLQQILHCLLLLAGDISLNPGPQWKFPCSLCSNPVKRNQHGIQCDNCDGWFHTRCCAMGDDTYQTLAASSCMWICC